MSANVAAAYARERAREKRRGHVLPETASVVIHVRARARFAVVVSADERRRSSPSLRGFWILPPTPSAAAAPTKRTTNSPSAPRQPA